VSGKILKSSLQKKVSMVFIIVVFVEEIL